MFHVHILLATDHNAFGAMVKASNVPHYGVACGVSSSRLICTGVFMKYYYRTFVYSNPTTQMKAQKTFGDGVMFLTVKTFLQERSMI